MKKRLLAASHTRRHLSVRLYWDSHSLAIIPDRILRYMEKER